MELDVEKSSEDEELIYVGMNGKQFDFEIIEEIPIIIDDVTTHSIEVFKDALMITLGRLNKTIEFLQGELEEKPLLIRTLMLRNANNSVLLNESFVNSFLKSQAVETTSSIIHKNHSQRNILIDNQDENLFPNDVISEQNVTSSSYANSFLTIDNLTSSTEHSLSSSFSDTIINNNKTFEVENILRTYESIDEQVTNYRNTNYNHYIEEKLQNNIKKSENNNDHGPKPWRSLR